MEIDMTSKKVRKALGQKKSSHIKRSTIIGLMSLIFMLTTSVISITAYEAHVINVLARIEPRENQCDALSIGYWRNHEGCSQGNGESIWTTEVNTLSDSFFDVFATYTGSQICENLWVPNCPEGDTVSSKLCKTKAHTLANELNIVSGHLNLEAILAGADDGAEAFDNLGLGPTSTVETALTTIESVIATPGVTIDELKDADHVAERIYAFYEEENPIAPRCIFSLDDLAQVQMGVTTSLSIVSAPLAVAETAGETPTEEPFDPAQDQEINEDQSVGEELICEISPEDLQCVLPEELIVGDEAPILSPTEPDEEQNPESSISQTNQDDLGESGKEPTDEEESDGSPDVEVGIPSETPSETEGTDEGQSVGKEGLMCIPEEPPVEEPIVEAPILSPTEPDEEQNPESSISQTNQDDLGESGKPPTEEPPVEEPPPAEPTPEEPPVETR